MLPSKVTIRRLSIQSPPLDPKTGGRIINPSGEIAQIVNGESFRFLAYIDFENNPNAPRGNHYHERKEEFLYIIRGKLRAIYKDIDTGESGEVIVETGDLITIKPRCAHVYFAMEYTQSIEFSRDVLDPSDTHRYTVITD